MVQKTTIAVACNKLLPYVPYFLLYCLLSVCARDAVTLLQSWGCWYVDKAARQSVGAGGTEAHWTSVGVESRSAADYTAESN